MRRIEARRYEPEVEIHAVTLGSNVDPVEAADALAVNQRGNRPPCDTHRAPLDLRPIRIEPCAAYHVEVALASELAPTQTARVLLMRLFRHKKLQTKQGRSLSGLLFCRGIRRQ